MEPRITTEEIWAKARQKGFSSFSDIDAIIFETTGEINIVAKINEDDVGKLEIVMDFNITGQ